MIKTNLKEIKDFQVCARLYDYRHKEKLPEKVGSRDLVSQRFENTLKSIVNFYFYKKQSGTAPSYASLLNRWEKMWYPKDTTAYDITHEQHESFYGNNASLTTKAAAALLGICENFGSAEIIPMAIDEDFMVDINEHVAVSDKFDLIYHHNGKTYVVKWVFNIKFKKEYLYSTDFAVLNKGFWNRYGSKIAKTEFGYYDLLNPKPNFTKFETKREDVETLSAWCTALRDEKFFLPKRGMISYCTQCPFDTPCSKWKLDTEKEINVK
jgi:hypothetical protein